MSEMTTTEIEKAKKYYPLPKLAEMSRIPDMDTYSAKWKESVENSEQFWADEAEKIEWFSPYVCISQAVEEMIYLSDILEFNMNVDPDFPYFCVV